jgi:stage II sporulation protein D
VGVPVPQDAGKTLWGHGVGMSATGALGMANEGKSYVDILKHFYQGTELRLVYR